MRTQTPLVFLPLPRDRVKAINGEKAKLHALLDHAWEATALHRRGAFFAFMSVAIRTWRETDPPTVFRDPD